MSIADDIWSALVLEQETGSWTSGEELAKRLNVTRAAIWKAIQRLQDNGHGIETCHGSGYRISRQTDVLSGDGIMCHLSDEAKHLVSLSMHESVDSTNNVAKQMADEGCSDYTVIVASNQTAGKGRRGRSFYSLGDSGVYLSMVIRPDELVQNAISYTAAAAIAVIDAISCIDETKQARIKWVNDVNINGIKVCGILTEATSDVETGLIQQLIVGIGINVYEPLNGFPQDIAKRAGAIFNRITPGRRNRIAAEVINRLVSLCDNMNQENTMQRYRELSDTIGKQVTVIGGSYDGCQGVAIGITDRYNLIIQIESGDTILIDNGEVSVR